MEKFTKPELLNFLCYNAGETDNQFVNSPFSGKSEDDNPEGL